MHSQSSIVEQQLAKLYFVLRTGHSTRDDASDDMKMAYSTAREHNDNEELQDWITESDCLKLDEAELTKKHVFVFEKFSGTAFERVKKAAPTVIGPRCLISCFMDNETIPLGAHPVYTMAMRNLTVCSSGLKAKEKAHLSQLVFYMGGYFLDVLNATCTHLVSSTVKSVKYEKAADIKLPIMHPDWVQELWEESQRRNVHAGEASFIERHRLPVFHALTFTSTGLTAAKKNEIKTLIESNGGNYIGAFKSEITDILILEKSSVGTAKFLGAVRCKKDCLSPDWIVDSAACGHALPIREYEVKSLKASTPTKSNDGDTEHEAIGGRVSVGDFNPDCTELSEISHANFSVRNVTINESIMSNGADAVPGRSCSVRPPSQKHRELLSRMTVQQAKKAGPVLDGCSVFLSGFTGEEKEKLNKILNAVGAVRYDELSGSVSHVIVGEQIVSELAQLRDSTAHLLTLEWLVKSIELRQLAPEDTTEYAFRPSGKGIAERAPEPPSPSSKRNLQRMNSGVFKRPEVPKFRLDEEDGPAPSTSKATASTARPNEEDSIMLQYMERNLAEKLPQAAEVPTEKQPADQKQLATTTSSSANAPSQIDSELESQFTEFMLGKTLFVFGFSDEDAVQIITDVKYCGGTIVDETYTDEVDYIVLPTSCIGTADFNVRGRETVNCIWLETCVQDGQCYPMEYYFAPIPYAEDDPRPLEGETLVISSYSGPERSFLIALGGMLGASVQERLVRKAAPLLVCKEATGAKYNAAIQWDLVVVRAEWLRECARTKRRVAEGPYLVGESICSAKNISIAPISEGNGCLPTTSTDDVDIDSVREEMATLKAQKDDDETLRPQASSTMKPLPKPTLGEFRYILEQKTREENDLQYGFSRLSTPELRKMSSDDRMVYSQELDQYEDLIVAQRAQRKPFDPNERSNPPVTVTGAMDSPAVLRNRLLSVLSGGTSSRSPATPGAGGSGSAMNNNTAVTPLGLGGGEYEALSVTQRVAEFDTPVREPLYKALKDEEEKERNASPRTRRMKELLATPHAGPGASDGHIRTPTLPECMTKPVTPYGFRPDASPENHAYHKRKLQHWDRFHKPHTGVSADGVETASQKDRRMSTPLSEIKRRFWRENLGDDYVDYIESKYTTQSNVQSLNRTGGDGEEDDEIAGTQQPKKDPSPVGTARQGIVESGNVGEAGPSSTRLSGSDRGNVSAEKRSRQELDDDDGDGDGSIGERSNESSIPRGQKPADEDCTPLAKKPLLSGAEDEYVKRLSDVISAARESAKKKVKHFPPPEQQYTELEAYDSEINAGVGGVIWRDRGVENVQLNKSPNADSKDNDGGKQKKATEVNRGMKYSGTPLFAITGVQEDVRLELTRKLEKLKGALAVDTNRYNPGTTHILCGKPNRGEKMLSGIAAGKWLLSTKYLDDSYEAGYFLDEECYEWGNPKAAKNLMPLTAPGELETAAAAYTWRKRIATDGGKHDGAFSGFRVLMVTDRKGQFERLLQSGGGFVVHCDPPFINSESAMSATHCFVDRKAKLPSDDHRALAEAGIAVLSIMYLNAYLTSEKLPNPNDFQLPM